MQLEGVELRRVDLALRRPLGTSAGVHDRRPVIFVRVACEGVEGWGECGALAEGTVVDPSVGEVWRTLTGGAIERLLQAARSRDGELPDASEVAPLCDTTPAGRMAAAALEMAVLDAELREGGASLASYLGTGGRWVAVGTLVGIPVDREVGTLLAEVADQVALGSHRVRVKIEPGWDVEPVLAVRRAHPELALQVDANGAYRLGAGGERAADRLVALDPLGLACIEQPLAPADLGSHAALARKLATPICLDESLTTVRRLVDAISCGACEVACLKPGRLGGLFAARRAHDACLAAGIPAFVGGFFETGLARSAHVALAAFPGFTLAGDLSDPASYLQENPCRYAALEDGRVQPPGAPGVGPAPDPDVLAIRTAATEWFPYRR
jgi:O-succinylbenzoate synthase